MAVTSADRIESRTVEIVQFSMREDGLGWVDVSADGLLLILEGTAPDEAARFRAISRAVSLVEGDRIVDRLDVVEPDSFDAPPFALEMLRNDEGISLIGLVPEAGTTMVTEIIPDIAEGAEVVDMVETADYPEPEGWDAAVTFGLQALRALPRAKVSVTEGRVEVEAVSRSPDERDAYLSVLESNVPDGIVVVLDISAPRPVITPFSLRFVRTEARARLEDCSADSEADQDQIVAAARAAGLVGVANCQIGLGIPSPHWAEAVELAIAATQEIGTATVSFQDADVTLVAAVNTEQDLFDRVVGQLEADLPDVFSLTAVLPTPSEEGTPSGPPSFVANLNEDGRVDLRGRLPDARIEAAVEAFAGSAFGQENVFLATRRVDDLPTGWSVRVLAGLAALGHLSTGDVRIEPDTLRVRGETGSTSAVSDIARLLSNELGPAASFDIDVDYIETLDPAHAIPSDEQCATRIAEVLAETKITFDPGSIEINEDAGAVLDRIAAILPDCRHVEMEIGGHTDSQGRETMNLRLSQSRADAVLNGLLARNILIGNLTARGYGESQPIASNDTETGRETNRRIEFRLLRDIVAAQEAAAAAALAEELANLPRPSPRPGPDPEPVSAEAPDPEPEAETDGEETTTVATPTADDPAPEPRPTPEIAPEAPVEEAGFAEDAGAEGNTEEDPATEDSVAQEVVEEGSSSEPPLEAEPGPEEPGAEDDTAPPPATEETIQQDPIAPNPGAGEAIDATPAPESVAPSEENPEDAPAAEEETEE